MRTGFGCPIDSKTAVQTVGPRGPMVLVSDTVKLVMAFYVACILYAKQTCLQSMQFYFLVHVLF